MFVCSSYPIPSHRHRPRRGPPREAFRGRGSRATPRLDLQRFIGTAVDRDSVDPRTDAAPDPIGAAGARDPRLGPPLGARTSADQPRLRKAVSGVHRHEQHPHLAVARAHRGSPGLRRTGRVSTPPSHREGPDTPVSWSLAEEAPPPRSTARVVIRCRNARDADAPFQLSLRAFVHGLCKDAAVSRTG